MWRSIASKSIHATRRFATSPKLTKVHTCSQALTPSSIPSRFSSWVLSTNQGRRFFSNFSESETDHTPLSSSAEYGDNFVENGDDITQLENENLGAWEQVSWDVDAEEDNQSHGQGNEDEVYVIDKEKLEPVLSFLHSKLNPVTCHTLIRGYCKLEQFDKALELLRDMKKYGVRPNVDEYNKFIRSLCLKALDWETAEKLLNEMEESGLHPNGMTKALVRGVKELAGEGLEIEARIEG